MHRIIIVPLAAFAGFLFLTPLITSFILAPLREQEADSADTSAQDPTATQVEGTAPPPIPSVAEAPPQWDGLGLVGTAWQASIARDFGTWDSEMLFMYSFNRPGHVVFKAIDPEIDLDPELSDSRRALRDQMLPVVEGSYTEEGGTIELRVPLMGREGRDTIEIRGPNLYYNNVLMTRIQPFLPD